VGKVGVVDRVEDGWIVVVVPGHDSHGHPFGKLLYKARELEPIIGPKGRAVVGTNYPVGWEVAG
jgi:hypothetical protein